MPVAILVIVVSLSSTALLTNSKTTELVASDSRWTAVFLANLRFSAVLPNLFATHPLNLNHYWSLAVEEQFYLFYPAFFLLLLAIPGRLSLRSRLTAGLTLVTVISFSASVATSRAGQFAAYYSPFTRAWELSIGCLLALGTSQFKKIPIALATAVTWIGLSGIIAAAATVSFAIPYPGYVAALPVISTALVIAGGATVPKRGAEMLLSLLPFRWIGRWSYSWYIWQPIIFVIAAEYTHTTLQESTVPRNLLLAVVALITAAASYFLIENPVRHAKSLTQSPRAVLVGAAFLITSCVAFTYLF